MRQRLLLQDACVLINLIASGQFEEIARGCGYQFVVASAVCAETHFTRDGITGERVPIDLNPYFDARLLETMDIETGKEQAAYILYAAQKLDDGEAMSLALAEARRLPLATDDRKARLLIANEKIAVELHGTVSLLQAWEKTSRINRADMAQVLSRIQNCARFIPRSSTDDHAWWIQYR